MVYKSCFEASFALPLSRRPRYWATTTAPPVESAENIWMMSVLILSTSDTPDTTASPEVVTITVSAMPTVFSKNCSITSGMTRRSSSLRVKRGRPAP